MLMNQLKKLCLLLFTLLTFQTLKSQECIMKLEESDFKDLKIVKTDVFYQNEVYNYFDGGAEMFLDYGLQSVKAQ